MGSLKDRWPLLAMAMVVLGVGLTFNYFHHERMGRHAVQIEYIKKPKNCVCGIRCLCCDCRLETSTSLKD